MKSSSNNIAGSTVLSDSFDDVASLLASLPETAVSQMLSGSVNTFSNPPSIIKEPTEKKVQIADPSPRDVITSAATEFDKFIFNHFIMGAFSSYFLARPRFQCYSTFKEAGFITPSTDGCLKREFAPSAMDEFRGAVRLLGEIQDELAKAVNQDNQELVIKKLEQFRSQANAEFQVALDGFFAAFNQARAKNSASSEAAKQIVLTQSQPLTSNPKMVDQSQLRLFQSAPIVAAKPVMEELRKQVAAFEKKRDATQEQQEDLIREIFEISIQELSNLIDKQKPISREDHYAYRQLIKLYDQLKGWSEGSLRKEDQTVLLKEFANLRTQGNVGSKFPALMDIYLDRLARIFQAKAYLMDSFAVENQKRKENEEPMIRLSEIVTNVKREREDQAKRQQEFYQQDRKLQEIAEQRRAAEQKQKALNGKVEAQLKETEVFAKKIQAEKENQAKQKAANDQKVADKTPVNSQVFGSKSLVIPPEVDVIREFTDISKQVYKTGMQFFSRFWGATSLEKSQVAQASNGSILAAAANGRSGSPGPSRR